LNQYGYWKENNYSLCNSEYPFGSTSGGIYIETDFLTKLKISLIDNHKPYPDLYADLLEKMYGHREETSEEEIMCWYGIGTEHKFEIDEETGILIDVSQSYSPITYDAGPCIGFDFAKTYDLYDEL